MQSSRECTDWIAGLLSQAHIFFVLYHHQQSPTQCLNSAFCYIITICLFLFSLLTSIDGCTSAEDSFCCCLLESEPASTSSPLCQPTAVDRVVNWSSMFVRRRCSFSSYALTSPHCSLNPLPQSTSCFDSRISYRNVLLSLSVDSLWP